MGIDAYDNWEDNAAFTISRNGATLCVQDKYDMKDVVSDPIADKWGSVRQHVIDAKTGSSGSWYINFASAVNLITRTPSDMAKGFTACSGYGAYVSCRHVLGVNDMLNLYIATSRRGRYGTILMDFPEYPSIFQIRLLIGMNYSLSGVTFDTSSGG